MRAQYAAALTRALARRAPQGVAVDPTLPGSTEVTTRHMWLAGSPEGQIEHVAQAADQWIRDDQFDLTVWCEDTSPGLSALGALEAAQLLIDVVETAVYGEQATIEAEVEDAGIDPLEMTVSALSGPIAEPTDQGFAGFAAVTVSIHGRRNGTPL